MVSLPRSPGPPCARTALDEIDSNQLIREAYRIEGIREPECRSIFLDWAIKLPSEIAPREAIAALLEVYGKDAPTNHPMSEILRAGLTETARSGRRGGRDARLVSR